MEKYEEIIENLRQELKDALSKNEQVSEVSELIQNLQEQFKDMFDENDRLSKENEEFKNIITENDTLVASLKEDNAQLEKKVEELKQKEKLQNMVLEGYKRKGL